MNLYILDTDIISLYQHDHPVVVANIQKHPLSELAITVFTVEEQLSGWHNELRKAKKRAALAAVYERMAQTVIFLGHMPIISFTESTIDRYENLKRLKLKVKKTDLRIAAIALECDAILVTRNYRDFGKMPGLRIEDWSK
jgi:tRNA(fMet)-specific endonuclease VapC